MTIADDPPADFDHVVLATRDPQALCARLEQEWGLRARRGFDFESGVSARVVPLEPPQYLEIVHLTDPARVPDGVDQRELARFRGEACLTGLALRATDLGRLAVRLGRPPITGDAVVGLAGEPPPWTVLAHDGEQERPWYIEYRQTVQERRDRIAGALAELGYQQPPGRIAWAECSGDVADLTAWLAPAAHLPLTILAGPSGLRVGLAVGERHLALSCDPEVGLAFG